MYLKPHPSEGPEKRIVKLAVSWCVPGVFKNPRSSELGVPWPIEKS